MNCSTDTETKFHFTPHPRDLIHRHRSDSRWDLSGKLPWNWCRQLQLPVAVQQDDMPTVLLSWHALNWTNDLAGKGRSGSPQESREHQWTSTLRVYKRHCTQRKSRVSSRFALKDYSGYQWGAYRCALSGVECLSDVCRIVNEACFEIH